VGIVRKPFNIYLMKVEDFEQSIAMDVGKRDGR